MAGEGDYKPPKGHDRHLGDSERAHSGAAGAKVRHGQNALGKLGSGRLKHPEEVNPSSPSSYMKGTENLG